MAAQLKLQFVIDAIDNATKKVRAVNDAVAKSREPWRKVRADMRELIAEAGWDRLRARVGLVAERAGAIRQQLTGVARAVGAVALAGIGVFAIFKRTADEVDRIADAAKDLGMTTQRLQGMGFGAQMSGSSPEEMQTALQFLAANMVEARNGSKEMQEQFARAGITMKELQTLKVDQVFERIADKYEAVGDAGQNAEKKIALSRALMGRSGAKMNQLLNQGSEGIRRYAAEARKLGIVLDDGTVDAMTAFNDSFDKAKNVGFGALANAFGRIAPQLTAMVDRITAWIAANRQWIALRVELVFERLKEALPPIWDGLRLVGQAFLDVARWADMAARFVGGWDNVIRILGAYLALSFIGNVLLLAGAIGQAALAFAGFVKWMAPMAAGMLGPLGPVVAVTALATALAYALSQMEAVQRVGGAIGRGLFGLFNDDVNEQENARMRERIGANKAISAFNRDGPLKSEVGGTLRIEIAGPGKVTGMQKTAGSNMNLEAAYTGGQMAFQ